MVDVLNPMVDVPNFIADVPNSSVQVPNPTADVPNSIADLPNFIADVPNFIADVPILRTMFLFYERCSYSTADVPFLWMRCPVYARRRHRLITYTPERSGLICHVGRTASVGMFINIRWKFVFGITWVTGEQSPWKAE